ncbi:MAG: O-antigen ligase family protein [Actinomycetota bacterium]|nr:O-antigen ligase family protein [Actinomycetota bacterium]
MRVRGADLAGAVFTAVVLCAVDPTRTTVATPWSWTVVTAGAAALLAVAAWQRTLVRPPRVAGWAYVAFLALLALAAAGGEDGRFAWLGIPQRHAGWLLWLLCGALFISGVRWKAVVDGMVAAGLVWLPVLFADALGHPWLGTGGQRLTGTFGSAAYLGAAACLVAPAALGVALDTRRRPWWRWSAAAAAGSAMFAAAGSGSRAAWLALLATGAVVAWQQRRSPWLLRVAAAAVVVVALAAVTTPAGSRVADVADSSAGGGASRLDEWRVGLATLSHHALLGAGPEGYRIVFHDGVDAEYERAYGRAVQPDRSHNGLLDIALAGGIPAALLYAGFLGTAAVHVRRRLRDGPPTPALVGALAATAAYLLQQQLLFPLAEVEPVLFLLAGGIVCSGQPPLIAPRSRVAARAGATAGAGALVVGARAGALVLAAAGLGAAWWGSLDIAAWRAADHAMAALAAGDQAAAAANARTAVDRRGDEVWLRLLLARTAATPQEALAAVGGALALSPGDPIAMRNRQELLVQLDPSLAFEELAALVAADPNNAALQQLYGTAAVRSGDEAIAERAWLRALALAPDAPGPRQNLITLYRQQGRDAEADALAAGGPTGPPAGDQAVPTEDSGNP